MDYDVVIIGAGFFGATLAERLANDAQKRVLIIDRRSHLGGNSFSEKCIKTGIEVHRYGSHIFHTKNKKVWDYVNQFTSFNRYKHQVLSQTTSKVYQFPPNLTTLMSFYPDIKGNDNRAKALLAGFSERYPNPKNLLEKGYALVGKPLFDALYAGYTEKQWGRPLDQLPASIINRIPVRTDFFQYYFDDPYQGIPIEGYGAIFRRMLADTRINTLTGTAHKKLFQGTSICDGDPLVIYTGPLDEYFNFCEGRLSWRSLRFEETIYDTADYQRIAVINHPDRDVPYTRTHEFRHYAPDQYEGLNKTVVYREYPIAPAEPKDFYYPVRGESDLVLYSKYRDRAKVLQEQTGKFFWGGRLADYKYYDMDATIAAALSLYEKLKTLS